MNAVFSPRRLGHVNLICEQLERSTRFYNEVCGLALEFSETGLRGNFMGTGNTHHDVGMIERTREDRYGKDGHLQIPKAAAANVGLNHIAWEMENELELVRGYERAQAAGVALARVSDHQISHSIYLKDPDGNVVEFYADVIRDWRSVLHGEVDHITSVWKPDVATASTERLWDTAPALRRVPQAAHHPRRLSHVVLETEDLPRMTRFYEEVAGLQRVYGDDAISLLRGAHAASRYHLALVHSPGKKGLHHFGFEVSDAKELGLGARREGPLKTSVFIDDPDGFRVEFFLPKAEDYAAVARAQPSERAFLV
jgi:catechol 2,3-dioxygenase